MSTFPKCPECGSDKTSTCAPDGLERHYIRCHACMTTTLVPADSSETFFGKYSEKDLVEMLVAIGLLTTYPETIAYVSQLQKDLEAVIDRLGG